jgi:hypothetical protein
MNKAVMKGCAILVVGLAVGCGRSEEDKVMKEILSEANQLAVVLEKVTDTESAKQAESEVERLDERSRELSKTVQSWPEEKREAMRLKYEADMKKLRARIDKARQSCESFLRKR